MAGVIIAVAGPSGAGKTEIVKRLTRIPGTAQLVTWTSRSPRQGETNGRDYFFTTREDFEAHTATGEMFEYALVHGQHYYGSSIVTVEEFLDRYRVLFAVLNLVGVRTFKQKLGERCVTLFIKPKPYEVLERRLRNRPGADPEDIARRLAESPPETLDACMAEFQHVVVNEEGKLPRAVRECYKIISSLL